MALLVGSHRRRRVAAFYGGVGFGSQLRSLRRGVDVAVACPGRLNDLIARGAVHLAGVSMVVIDEADRMADMGFLPEVKRILDQVRPDRQTLLFSATLDSDVGTLIRRYQQNPVRVTVGADEQQSRLTSYHWVDTRREDRVALAARYVTSHGSTIVFCRTKLGADRVAKQLVAAGVKAVPLHGGRSQSQRDRALAAFSGGRAQALVATDVAARGIHVDNVGCVVHFDLPATDKDYLHRSGRTGRAGAKGVVIALVTASDSGPVKALQKALGHPISPKWGYRGINEVLPRAEIQPPAPERAHTTGNAGAPRRSGPEPQPRHKARPSHALRHQTSATPKTKSKTDRPARSGRSPRRRPRAA
jgi:superfamily II DNA/RNA helicase